jgi:hypothetical protein
VTKMMEVITASVPEADQNIVILHTHLLMNTGGGRPSDCARQAVREYELLGRHEFITKHYDDNRQALRTCGCEACLRDLAAS